MNEITLRSVSTEGHSWRSWYAETLWLPVLGPTSYLAGRLLSATAAELPGGVGQVDSTDLLQRLGLTAGGPTNPRERPTRVFGRLARFKVARWAPDTDDLDILENLPDVGLPQFLNLPLGARRRAHDLGFAPTQQQLEEFEAARDAAR